jgi:uncharacterized membrane protein SpoIIM required for sporulation
MNESKPVSEIPTPNSLPVGVYSPGWVGFATYLGSLLAGCYLLSRNDQALGEENRSATLFSIGIAGTVLMGFILGVIPESLLDAIPNSFIPMVYTVAIYAYVEQTQRKRIDAGIAADKYFKASGWKATGIAIICLLISVILIFAGAMAGAVVSGQW